MNKRYDEFRIEEREHTPPVVVDRNGHERVTTVVERMLWQLVMRDDDKSRLLAKDARIADLENSLRSVLAWIPDDLATLLIDNQWDTKAPLDAVKRAVELLKVSER